MDLKNAVEKLSLEMRQLRYDAEIHVEDMKAGSPRAFLPLLHYILLGFSRPLAQWISEKARLSM